MARVSKKSIKKAAKRKPTKRVVNKRIKNLLAQIPQTQNAYGSYNPLAEMPKGANLRQTLLQKAMIGLPQNAPLSAQQGDMFNLRNEFTKQGDLLKEMKLQIKRDDDARKMERERKNADDMLRGARQRNEIQKQVDARHDELHNYEYQLKQQEIEGETAHAQALVNQQQQLIQLGALKIDLENKRNERQQLDDQGISIRYNNEIQLLEQQLIAITNEINALLEGGNESIAKSKNVAEMLQALMTYLEAVKTELKTLRSNKGEYDALLKASNGNSIQAQAQTLEALSQINADDRVIINKEQMKLQAVRDTEIKIGQLDIENTQLLGQYDELKSQTALTNKHKRESEFAKRKKSANDSLIELKRNISNKRHQISLNEDELRAVEALERDNLSKVRDYETLTKEQEALQNTIDSRAFKKRRKTLLDDRGTNEVNLMTAKSKGNELKHEFEHRDHLVRELSDTRNEYESMNTTNEKLKEHIDKPTFNDSRKRLLKSIGTSRNNVAAAKRAFDEYQSQINSSQSLKSELRNTTNAQLIQDATNAELKTHVEGNAFKKEMTDNINSIASTTQKIDVGKIKKNVYQDRLNTNESLQKRANKLNTDKNELNAHNDASKNTEMFNNVLSKSIGIKRANYDAARRMGDQQKEYITAQDRLTQMKAYNEANENDKEIKDTNTKIMDLSAKRALSEERAAAVHKANVSRRALRDQQITTNTMLTLQTIAPEVVTANADAITNQVLTATIDEKTREAAAIVRTKEQITLKHPGVYRKVFSLMPSDFDYDRLSLEQKGLFNTLLEHERDGRFSQADADAFNQALGTDIVLQ